jgi:hypothetical protein
MPPRHLRRLFVQRYKYFYFLFRLSVTPASAVYSFFRVANTALYWVDKLANGVELRANHQEGLMRQRTNLFKLKRLKIAMQNLQKPCKKNLPQ